MYSSISCVAPRNRVRLVALSANPADLQHLIRVRAARIERAARSEDVIEVLGTLAKPVEVTLICAAFRAGCADQALGPVLTAMLRREWRGMADAEIADEINEIASGHVADDWIPPYVLARDVLIAQMGGRHG